MSSERREKLFRPPEKINSLFPMHLETKDDGAPRPSSSSQIETTPAPESTKKQTAGKAACRAKYGIAAGQKRAASDAHPGALPVPAKKNGKGKAKENVGMSTGENNPNNPVSKLLNEPQNSQPSAPGKSSGGKSSAKAPKESAATQESSAQPTPKKQRTIRGPPAGSSPLERSRYWVKHVENVLEMYLRHHPKDYGLEPVILQIRYYRELVNEGQELTLAQMEKCRDTARQVDRRVVVVEAEYFAGQATENQRQRKQQGVVFDGLQCLKANPANVAKVADIQEEDSSKVDAVLAPAERQARNLEATLARPPAAKGILSDQYIKKKARFSGKKVAMKTYTSGPLASPVDNQCSDSPAVSTPAVPTQFNSDIAEECSEVKPEIPDDFGEGKFQLDNSWCDARGMDFMGNDAFETVPRATEES